MSEASYQQNVLRGVTGFQTETCLPASHDRISHASGIHPSTYEEYHRLVTAYVEQCGDNALYVPPEIVRRYQEVVVAYHSELGVRSPRNVVYGREDTEAGLRRRLAKLSLGGFRIAVLSQDDGLHSVGVTQVEADWYDVRSTSSPFNEGEPVHVSKIYHYLDRSHRVRKRAQNGKNTFKEANLIALPPEAH